MRIWARRGGGAVVVWGSVVAVMAAAGMGPRPVPLAVLSGVLVVVISLVIDLGQEPVTADWPGVRIDLSSSTDDARVRQLQRAIEAATSDDVRVAVLRGPLADLVAERVRAHHGVDRAADPERYRRIVGADLAAWLDPPDGEQTRMTRQELGVVVSRIEGL